MPETAHTRYSHQGVRAYPCRYGISSDHDVHCADCGGIHSDFEGCFRPKEKDIGWVSQLHIHLDIAMKELEVYENG